MEVTCKMKMMFIPIKYVVWDTYLLEKCIVQLGVQFLECFRNRNLFLGLLGMLER
jgi:hypothetical protein